MRIIFVFLLLISPITSFCQNNYEKAIIETQNGAYIVFTNDSNSFILEIDTAKIEPMDSLYIVGIAKNDDIYTAEKGSMDSDKTLFILVDSKWILQLFTIDFQNVENKSTNDLEVQKRFLYKYINYEMEYLKNELKLSLENLSINRGTINNNTFVLWYFDTPEYETAQKQIYLSTICFNHFLNINIPLPNDETLENGIAFVKRIGNSLKRYSHSTDIENLYKNVNGLE